MTRQAGVLTMTRQGGRAGHGAGYGGRAGHGAGYGGRAGPRPLLTDIAGPRPVLTDIAGPSPYRITVIAAHVPILLTPCTAPVPRALCS